jgi:hypothetical protein
VDGNDVVGATAAMFQVMVKPTFKAGQGGKAGFESKVTANSGTSTGYVCVQSPKTPCAIAVIAAC